MGFQNLHQIACIHGRFQPFHLGHVDYLQVCLQQWQQVLVGVAEITPVRLSFPGVEHRNRPSANPLTYLERTIIIRECGRNLGISDSRIEFIPFPIDEPSTLPNIFPRHVACVTTRLYDWNDEKIRRLKNEGYSVHVLEQCQKVPFDGSKIRALIRSGDDSWRAMVNPAVAHLLDCWELRPRLERLAADEKRDA